MSLEEIRSEHIKLRRVAYNLFEEQLELRLGLCHFKNANQSDPSSSGEDSNSFAGLVKQT
jgi:hypothetical protein